MLEGAAPAPRGWNPGPALCPCGLRQVAFLSSLSFCLHDGIFIFAPRGPVPGSACVSPVRVKVALNKHYLCGCWEGVGGCRGLQGPCCTGTQRWGRRAGRKWRTGELGAAPGPGSQDSQLRPPGGPAGPVAPPRWQPGRWSSFPRKQAAPGDCGLPGDSDGRSPAPGGGPRFCPKSPCPDGERSSRRRRALAQSTWGPFSWLSGLVRVSASPTPFSPSLPFPRPLEPAPPARRAPASGPFAIPEESPEPPGHAPGHAPPSSSAETRFHWPLRTSPALPLAKPGPNSRPILFREGGRGTGAESRGGATKPPAPPSPPTSGEGPAAAAERGPGPTEAVDGSSTIGRTVAPRRAGEQAVPRGPSPGCPLSLPLPRRTPYICLSAFLPQFPLPLALLGHRVRGRRTGTELPSPPAWGPALGPVPTGLGTLTDSAPLTVQGSRCLTGSNLEGMQGGGQPGQRCAGGDELASGWSRNPGQPGPGPPAVQWPEALDSVLPAVNWDCSHRGN